MPSSIAVVAVFARYKLVNERKELHLLGSDYLVDYVRIVAVAHVHEVLIGCYEWLLAQLRLQVYTESFNSVAHRI